MNNMLIIKLIFNVLLFITGFINVTSKTGPTHDKIVVCYLSTWAVYRPGRGSYSIDNFDASLCTHAIYAFSGLDAAKDTIKSLDPWQDLVDNYGKGGFERLTSLKTIHPHLKVTLAIGGWNEGSANYSQMAADPNKRKRFITSASEFVRKYNFDGLDLDWEYPALRGGQPEDKENFVLLVKELKENFKQHNLLLTSAIGAAKHTIDQAYNVKKLSRYLDFLHIMCYDYGGSWDKRVSANAPLTSNDFLNIEFTIDYLLKLGANPSKIVMGLPFYGRTFITNLEGNYGDASNDIGFHGPFTKENGFLGYNELCAMLSNKSEGWTSIWDGPTAQNIGRQRNNETGETKVVVYDSTRSIANKMRYLIKKQLAGAMVWSVDTDDFLGDCNTADDTYADFNVSPGVKLVIPKRINSNYPLLRTINEAVLVTMDEIQQEEYIKNSEEENEISIDDDNSEENSSPTHGKVVVCYISTWAFYRPGLGSYSINNFDASLCTHAVYAFAGLDATTNTIKARDPWYDLVENYGHGGFERLTSLKSNHPHLKVTLAIGGWIEGSANYSQMVADPNKRKDFVASVTAFVRKYNFDGLDLHWEYPTLRDGLPEDKENFVLLVKELKENFKQYKLLLTSGIGATKHIIDHAYNVKELSIYLDYLHVMCYDYGGSWDEHVSANAPLTSPDWHNIEFTIDYLLKLGANASKIVMGLPFYGRTFITNLEGNYGDASNDIGFHGPFTKENGFLGYNELCAMLSNKSEGWTSIWDGPTAQNIGRQRNNESGETKVIVYDSTRSIANKIRFLIKKQLAGTMVWSVDTDDFLGYCNILDDDDTYADFNVSTGVKLIIPKRINSNYPLLRTISEAVLVTMDEIKQEEDIKNSEEENEIPIDEDASEETPIDEDNSKENPITEDSNEENSSNFLLNNKVIYIILIFLALNVIIFD